MPSFSHQLVASTEAILSWLSARGRQKHKAEASWLPWLNALTLATWVAAALAVSLLFLVQVQPRPKGEWVCFWRAGVVDGVRGQTAVWQEETVTIWGIPGDVLRWSGDTLKRYPSGSESPVLLWVRPRGEQGLVEELRRAALGRDPDSEVLRVETARAASGTWVPRDQLFVQTSSGSRLVPRDQVHSIVFEVNHGQ